MPRELRHSAVFGAFVEEVLARRQPVAVDRRDHLRRSRTETWWTGWLVSAVVHAILVLVLAILLLPSHLGELAALQCEMSLESEQTRLETFTMSGEDEGAELAVIQDRVVSEVFEETVPQIAHPFAGGSSGSGARGWQDSSAGQRGDSGGRSGPRAEFFGTAAAGDRFVYVLDISGSMNGGVGGEPRKGCRFERACAELLKSIDRLREDQNFYVILFSYKTLRMFDSKSPLPQMLRATPENKQRLKSWLASVELGGGTDPREALRLGLQLKPSAVFLLSDGEFNGRRNTNGSGVFSDNPHVFQVVERSNSGRSPIHTFAYEDQMSRDNMYDLAMQTGGVYRFVPGQSTATESQRRESNPPRVGPAKPSQPPARRADSLFRLAKMLESAGKRQKAMQRYRKIVDEFPNTNAAGEARKRLQRR